MILALVIMGWGIHELGAPWYVWMCWGFAVGDEVCRMVVE